MSLLRVRQANAGDVPFLLDAIISAEKSGTERLSYSTLFGLTEETARAILGRILAEDVAGQELCISGFCVVEDGCSPVAAACGWVEGAGGRPSGVLKASLLLHFFGRDCLTAAAPRLKLVEEIHLQRTPGRLQLESVYVASSHRGRGLFASLLHAHSKRASASQPSLDAVEIMLMKHNPAALRSYSKAGFEVSAERNSHNPALTALLPAGCRILMSRKLG